MKKIFIVLLILLSSVSASYAALEDMSVYVRQDVFDAKMEALFNRLHAEISELKTEMKAEISELRGDVRALSARMDGLERRIGDTHNFLYLLLVLFGAMLLLPSINKWWKTREEKKRSATSLTVDDVKRLIAEAKLSGTPQV